MPSKPGPVIRHGRYPIGAIPRAGADDQLRVGVASIDLTPPRGRAWIAGFGPMHRVSKVLDPVGARCVYFERGRSRVALVTADVIGILRPTVLRVRALVGNGIDVILTSTHNHASPDTLGFWGPAILYAIPHRSGIDLRYQKIFERRLAEVVRRAASSARPARLSIAEGELPAGVARNLRPPHVIDPHELVVAADGVDGHAIATITSFACHVETLGDRNRKLSAGFPAHLRARIESARGGLAMFVNGALGGMVTPEVSDEAEAPERERRDREIGALAGDSALSLLARAKPLDPSRLGVVSAAVDVPVDNPLYAYIERVGIVEGRAHGADGASFVSEVGRLDLGSLAVALIPGEPSPKVGRALRESLLRLPGAAHAAVFGLANDELGYVLAEDEAAHPEFEYELSMSPSPKAREVIASALSALPPPASR
ncbi:MAG: hypothetical protein HYV07_20415 [Deltaproteobacteria bacterium]|nr:hypothetical protein [Deltaproteobacteria bacterium]